MMNCLKARLARGPINRCLLALGALAVAGSAQALDFGAQASFESVVRGDAAMLAFASASLSDARAAGIAPTSGVELAPADAASFQDVGGAQARDSKHPTSGITIYDEHRFQPRWSGWYHLRDGGDGDSGFWGHHDCKGTWTCGNGGGGHGFPPVPEPDTLALTVFGLGVAALLLRRRSLRSSAAVRA